MRQETQNGKPGAANRAAVPPSRVQEWGGLLFHWRRRLATFAVFLVALWLAFGVISGPNGWIAYRTKRHENRQLHQQVQQLQVENQDLERRVKALRTDPKAIEQEAREQLRYAKPGEIIYVMPETRTAPLPQPPENATAEKK